LQVLQLLAEQVPQDEEDTFFSVPDSPNTEKRTFTLRPLHLGHFTLVSSERLKISSSNV
jgi:hypothetical protein